MHPVRGQNAMPLGVRLSEGLGLTSLVRRRTDVHTCSIRNSVGLDQHSENKNRLYCWVAAVRMLVRRESCILQQQS